MANVGVMGTGAPGYCSGPYGLRSRAMHGRLAPMDATTRSGRRAVFWGTDITKMARARWRHVRDDVHRGRSLGSQSGTKELVMAQAVCGPVALKHHAALEHLPDLKLARHPAAARGRRARVFATGAATITTTGHASKELGFGDTVIGGRMTLSCVTELLTRHFGRGFYVGGRLDVKFTNVLWPNEPFTTRGIIMGRRVEDGQTRAGGSRSSARRPTEPKSSWPTPAPSKVVDAVNGRAPRRRDRLPRASAPPGRPVALPTAWADNHRHTDDRAMTQAPQICPLGATLGTEALGIDLAKPLEEGIFAWIQGVFAEHPVLVFRDQDLSAPELAAFGRRFGTPSPPRAAQVSPRRVFGSLLADQRGRDWRDRLVRRQARHRLAHRFDVRGHAAPSGRAARQGGAFAEGRHDVRRHARGLRGLARAQEAAPVRPHRPARPRRRAPVWRRLGRDREELQDMRR